MKNIYRKLCIVAVILLCTCAGAQAQSRLITGTVTDPSGMAMPGVNVLIKGTSQGTATDVNGKFSLEASSGDVLVISFIGYSPQEIAVGNQTTLDVVLEEDLISLTEVVVVGYGVQKKALNTGANLQVTGDAIKKQSTTNALQALQGQAAGVQITSTSGQPGEAMKVTVRGMGTVGNSQPLYVVDGVLTDDISYLNPADIESIDVLKDAASAAIYGSQAANGVVLITTRKGQAGHAQITFDAFYGVQKLARKINLLNSKEYATIMNEAAVNSGKLPYFTQDEVNAMGQGTDWLDQMFVDSAPTQNYIFGASGGTETSTYSTSLGYQAQEGIVGGKKYSNYERYTFRFNSQHKLYKDIIRLGENLSFAYVNKNGVSVGDQYSNSLRSAFNTSPFVPMYDSAGNFWDNSNSDWYNGEANPYADMVYNNNNETNEQKLIGNFYLEAEPIKNLIFRTSIGLDYHANESHSYKPEYTLSIYSYNNLSSVDQSIGKGRTWLWDNTLRYSFNLSQQHQFDVMVGTSAYQYFGTSMWVRNTNYVFDDLEHAWITNTTNTIGSNISLKGLPDNEDKRLSAFGRVSYNFEERYLLNATFRADGSSRFAPGNRWGYFPSLSAGWVISDEAFMQDIAPWLNSLKMRASWGQVGNQRVEFFQYLTPITFTYTNYTFSDEEGVLTPGVYPSRLANPDVKWETSEQTDIGFDARLAGGRVSASVDWYNKTTKDWLVPAPVLASAGADAPYINGGDVKNNGVEVALSYNGQIGEVDYSISANGAYNKNEVGNIPTEDGIIHGKTGQLFDNSSEFYRAQSGYPIGYFWGLKTDGIFQTEEEVNSYRSNEGTLIQKDAQPGDVRYVDRDGDGTISDKDKTMIGNPSPDFTYGLSISAKYKNFDLFIQASGVAGNQIVQSYRNHANQYSNYTTAILDRWHGPGSSNSMPRVTENGNNWAKFSDLYVHDGDYMRLNNLTLGYNLKPLLKNADFVNQLRIYASALNLFTLTRYTGMDPEVGFGIDEDSDVEERDAFTSGIDLGYYPRPRTFMIGLNVKF